MDRQRSRDEEAFDTGEGIRMHEEGAGGDSVPTQQPLVLRQPQRLLLLWDDA